MTYITSLEMANKIGKTKRWVNDCCAKGLVQGAYKEGNRWLIPADTRWKVGSENRYAPLPIGVSNFELAISDYYYVDKTALIKDVIDYRPQVALFLRPRRFGKSLNLDMLKTFFEKNADSKADLFSGTNIWRQGSKYTNEQGKYPVIYFTFKDIKFSNWDETLINLKNTIQLEYRRHSNILESPNIQQIDKDFFSSVVDGTLNSALWVTTLSRLSEMLHLAEEESVFILIDEYDTPIQQGHTNGFYDEVVAFMRNLLSGGLKDNPHLHMAFLTGILRVAKESIFSGLNNLYVSSVLEKRYSEFFGFTESEVKKILNDYGCGNKLTEIKNWFDGYKFGDTEIYNPWSVLNYVDAECIPKAYWQSTGSNDVIGELLSKGDTKLLDEVRGLLLGGSKKAYVDTAVIYPEVIKNPSSVFSFLLMGGYLTIEQSETMFDGNMMCELKIPNKEIQLVYEKEILSRQDSMMTQDRAIAFQTALMTGDAIELQNVLQSFLKETISYYDAAAEGFYHGLILGLSATLYRYYEIQSNREAGNGRFDIRLKARDTINPNFIIEVKSVKDELPETKIKDKLTACAEQAVLQIDAKDYAMDLQGEVRKIGVAFWKKNCVVISK
ncbi:AAA family ATPase [Pseudobutyrivibrio xylanivorans]|nr:AAA family ATPase [Pseudobutyrivibrio xylanivorans]